MTLSVSDGVLVLWCGRCCVWAIIQILPFTFAAHSPVSPADERRPGVVVNVPPRTEQALPPVPSPGGGGPPPPRSPGAAPPPAPSPVRREPRKEVVVTNTVSLTRKRRRARQRQALRRHTGKGASGVFAFHKASRCGFVGSL